MENKVTPELTEKAKAAKSAEEILLLAKGAQIEMTAEEAEELYSMLHRSGELSDDEIDNVAGGSCYDKSRYLKTTIGYSCSHYTWRGSNRADGKCNSCRYWFPPNYPNPDHMKYIGVPGRCSNEANRQ